MHSAFPKPMLEFLTPDRIFARLSIASKMLLGYMALVVLTVGVVAYALLNLQQLNNLNSEIVKIDIPVQEASDKMLDALFAQDTYEKRYLILKGTDMRILFKKRSDEFKHWLDALHSLSDHKTLPIEQIAKMHKQYDDLFEQEMRLVRVDRGEEAMDISNNRLKQRFDRLLELLRQMSVDAKLSQDGKMKNIAGIGRTAFMTTGILCILSIVLGAIAGMVVTHHISSSINKLRIATAHIADGDFQYDPRITTRDEIGALAEAFVLMGTRLRKLEEMYLDASPLTRLPGGIAIENVLKHRLESKRPLAFCVLDLDNFKAFNDLYGYAGGNRVIKETARIIETAVKEKGGPNDFVGHVGGDDFVVITEPSRMRDVSSEIIRVFDRKIPLFYDEKVRAAGFIQGKNRQGQDMKFPIMTISIAIVTNEQREFRSSLEASETAAELKDYAKTIPASVYVVDKRREP